DLVVIEKDPRALLMQRRSAIRVDARRREDDGRVVHNNPNVIPGRRHAVNPGSMNTGRWRLAEVGANSAKILFMGSGVCPIKGRPGTTVETVTAARRRSTCPS